MTDRFLKTKRTGELGRCLSALATGDHLTNGQLDDIGGKARSAWMCRLAALQFDNLTIEYHKGLNRLHFVNVVSDSTGDDFVLRVKTGSELDRCMDALATGPKTNEELQKAGGRTRSDWMMRILAAQFDNLAVENTDGKNWMNYIDGSGSPKQPTVIQIEQAELTGTGAVQPKTEEPEIDEVTFIWPTAPRLLETSDYPWFRKPRWFGEMEAMSHNGSHTSLAGPPSVGKDTAVEYLSALDGRPLVVETGSGLRRKHLVGTPEMVGGRSFFNVAEAAAAIVNGWNLLITEINAADPDVILFLNGILAAPYTITLHGRSFPVHKNFRLFISYNPGLRGTKPLPESTKDRFYPIRVDFFTENELRSRLEAHGMPETESLGDSILVNGNELPREDWPDRVVEFGMKMNEAYGNGKFHYQVTFRRLLDAVTLMNLEVKGNVKEALKAAVIDTIDDRMGYKAARGVLDEVFDGTNSFNRRDW
jgi:hypothetical protein